MHSSISFLRSAAVTAALLGAAQVVSAGSLTGTTASNTYAPAGYAGAAFQSDDGTTLQSDPSASGGVLARQTFNNAPGEPFGLPDDGVRFAGIFEFDYTAMTGFEAIQNNPSQDYRYDFTWRVSFYSGEPENTTSDPVTFTRSVVANYHEANAGWISDGNGNHFAIALYPDNTTTGEGIFAWATSGPAGEWWDGLDGEGGRYDPSEPNSAYITTGGSIDITATAIPSPSAAMGGLALLGGVVLRRRPNAAPAA